MACLVMDTLGLRASFETVLETGTETPKRLVFCLELPPSRAYKVHFAQPSTDGIYLHHTWTAKNAGQKLYIVKNALPLGPRTLAETLLDTSR